MGLKGKIGKYTIILGEVNTLLSVTARTMDQKKFSEVTEVLTILWNQFCQIDIYRLSIPTTANIHSFQLHMEYLPSNLGQNPNLNNLNIIEIIRSMPDCNGVKVRINM